jgi:hypothetical protein
MEYCKNTLASSITNVVVNNAAKEVVDGASRNYLEQNPKYPPILQPRDLVALSGRNSGNLRRKHQKSYESLGKPLVHVSHNSTREREMNR